MHDFRKLVVWQRSRDLVVAIDRLSRKFPRADNGVIASQLRRAVISISANIAEGCGKSSRRETLRFLQIAAGSTSEVENHLLIAASLGYLAESVAEDLVGQANVIRLMLNKLMKNLPA